MDGADNDKASGKEGETYLSKEPQSRIELCSDGGSTHLLGEGHCSGLRQTGESEDAHRIVPVECLGGLASPEQMIS
ncbi:hypothetical protein DHEL01_v201026 [Diaporthe helianthi]|uniref:Uncharacterized protein n=1 Tax=Diaporthe helianthi TaxID=158607 RepID=A0A2P5IDH8_DIAHE|nr:hypothetical protein DHEL01_v201026 [Diaporthe helianthi]